MHMYHLGDEDTGGSRAVYARAVRDAMFRQLNRRDSSKWILGPGGGLTTTLSSNDLCLVILFYFTIDGDLKSFRFKVIPDLGPAVDEVHLCFRMDMATIITNILELIETFRELPKLHECGIECAGTAKAETADRTAEDDYSDDAVHSRRSVCAENVLRRLNRLDSSLWILSPGGGGELTTLLQNDIRIVIILNFILDDGRNLQSFRVKCPGTDEVYPCFLLDEEIIVTHMLDLIEDIREIPELEYCGVAASESETEEENENENENEKEKEKEEEQNGEEVCKIPWDIVLEYCGVAAAAKTGEKKPDEDVSLYSHAICETILRQLNSRDSSNWIFSSSGSEVWLSTTLLNNHSIDVLLDVAQDGDVDSFRFCTLSSDEMHICRHMNVPMIVKQLLELTDEIREIPDLVDRRGGANDEGEEDSRQILATAELPPDFFRNSHRAYPDTSRRFCHDD